MKRLRNTGPVFKRALLILLSSVFILQSFTFSTWAKYGVDADEILDNIYNGYVFHIKSCDGRYLDVKNGGTGDGTTVWTYNFNVNAACQEWKIIKCGTHNGNNLYKIQDVNSGKYLTIPGNSYSAQMTCLWQENNGDGQVFKIVNNLDGTYTFLTKCSGYRKALIPNYAAYASPSASVWQKVYNSGNSRYKWTIELAGQNRYEYGVGVCDGDYMLNNLAYSIEYVYDGGTSYYRMVTWNKSAYNGTYRLQKESYGASEIEYNCRIKYEGKGYYSLAFLGGSQYYTSVNRSGQPIVINSNNSDPNNQQLWKITRVNDDTHNYECYTIQSKGNQSLYLSSSYNYIETSSNLNEKSKWRLLCEENSETEYDCYFCGIYGYDYANFSKWIGTGKSVMNDFGFNSFRTDYAESYNSKNLFVSNLEKSKLTIIDAHGFGETNDLLYSHIQLHDCITSGSCLLCNTDRVLRNADLSDTELIMFISCSTSANMVNGGSNLSTVAVDTCGAQMAVGFDINISIYHAEVFIENFFKKTREWFDTYGSYYNAAGENRKKAYRKMAYEQAIQYAATQINYGTTCGHTVIYYGEDWYYIPQPDI